MLLSGDISLNPGPIRYPCTVCGKSVASNQKALSCDACQEWSHANCAGVDDSLYRRLQSVAQFSWQCPSCLFGVLPTDEVCECGDFTLPQSPAGYSPLELALPVDILCDSFNGIQIVNHNVQGHCSKMDELADWFRQCNGRDVVFCFSEIWIKPNSPALEVPGFSMLFSPFHSRSSGNLLPGSCIFLPDSLQTEYPDVCKSAEESCTNLNVWCCFVICKHQRIAVISVYRSPSTSLMAAIDELSAVLYYQQVFRILYWLVILISIYLIALIY